MSRKHDRHRRRGRRDRKEAEVEVVKPVEERPGSYVEKVNLSFVARGGVQLNLVPSGVRIPQEALGPDGQGLAEATLAEILRRGRKEEGES